MAMEEQAVLTMEGSFFAALRQRGFFCEDGRL
jgi:hypothetical protein